MYIEIVWGRERKAESGELNFITLLGPKELALGQI